MEARDFRKRAREKLKGKWSDAIVLTLVFVAFTAIVEWLGSLGENARLLSIASMAGLFSMIVMPAIKYGLTYSYMKLKNGEKVHPFDFLNYGFSNFEYLQYGHKGDVAKNVLVNKGTTNSVEVVFESDCREFNS